MEPSPPQGLLPAKTSSAPKYTLVLDMDETLIHYVNAMDEDRFEVMEDEDLCFYSRPGLYQFLKDLKDHYEIVVFTAATQSYADWVLNQIDIYNAISHRLYRKHTTRHEDDSTMIIKDLSRIGRNLSKTLIVDNIAENFEKQQENGIHIKSWFNELEDTALFDLKDVLIKIA